MQNLNSLLLISKLALGIISIVLAVVLLIAVVMLVMIYVNKKSREKQVGTFKDQLNEMKKNAEAECKAMKKEAIWEAKEQDLKRRKEFENETREQKAELAKYEQRLVQKDDILNKKDANLL